MSSESQPTPEQRAATIIRLAKDAVALMSQGKGAEGDRQLSQVQEHVARLTADLNRLRAGLEWFADKGHYTTTYRRGAGFADVFGERFARGLLDGKTIEQLEDE